MNLVEEIICTVAPVQIEGYVGPFEFYFRSRHEAWTFAIADNLEAIASIPGFDVVAVSDASQGFFRSDI